MLNKLRLSWGEQLAKELFDRVGALLLLVALSPLLLLLAVVARLDCGGVFERHTALGLGGRPFQALKFRTTRVAAGTAAEDDATRRRRQKGMPIRDDPRVTPAGRILRRTSLDELPQLWNVLRGQMSLVGPYKIAPDDRHHYGTRWLSVVTLKPGLTGMAQVHGRGELTIEERAILDAEYVRAYSLWRDVTLLAASIPAAIRGRGAF
jgi:lipopolysaccharide/colanic/teichoic acid biosynthesis glycosyltransferase